MVIIWACLSIQEQRKKIKAHLDILEEQAIGNLDAEEAKIKSEIENLLEKLSKKAVSIEMLQSKLSAVKLYASDLQTVLVGRTYRLLCSVQCWTILDTDWGILW
jgi:uncharacterized membrane protein YgaE (UPF0421/DUF939 family)